jgi:hypothetical protein
MGALATTFFEDGKEEQRNLASFTDGIWRSVAFSLCYKFGWILRFQSGILRILVDLLHNFNTV